MVGSKNLSVNYEQMDIIDMMSEFTGKSTSIDLGYYDIFDPYTRRRISVTASYFLAKNLIPHLLTNGLNKPFVYSFAQLNAIQRNTALTVSGNMIRDSFRPDIDLIDWDVKEQLYTNRINYYITSEEGRVVQRACQNTRQLDASALLEENNVRVLNSLKIAWNGLAPLTSTTGMSLKFARATLTRRWKTSVLGLALSSRISRSNLRPMSLRNSA